MLCPVKLVDFACKVFQVGLEKLLPSDKVGNSYKFNDGSLGTDPRTKRPGGFVTTKSELLTVLYENFFTDEMTEEQMLERVQAMDSQADSLQSIATKLQAKLRKCRTHKEVRALMDKVEPLLKETQAKLAKL